jgi:peptidoglycan/LPS O-acetylase OafA/YrhL
MTGSRLSHRPALDGVRGIAVLVVVMAHAQALIYGGPIFGWLDFSGGFLGVDIFFVLSGFLITSLLLEEYEIRGKISLRNFYIRRALRLLPALFLFLVAMIIYSRLALPAEIAQQTVKFAAIAILYITNWARAFEWIPGSQLLGHLWSLAVEEQFYLLWPPVLVLLFKVRISRRALVLFVSALIALVTILRVWLLIKGGISQGRIYLGSDTRADSLLVGCVAAMLHTWQMLPSNRAIQYLLRMSPLISIPMFCLYFFDVFGIRSRSYFAYGLLVVALCVAIVLLQAMQKYKNPFLLVLENIVLAYVGRISYGLYLWHFFAIEASLRVPASNGVKLALSFLTLFGIAAMSYYIIERPFLRLKKRFAASTETSSKTRNIDCEFVTAEAS